MKKCNNEKVDQNEKKFDWKYALTLGVAVILCGAMLPFAIIGGTKGKDGINGQNGAPGLNGQNGVNGKSAYEVYVDSVPTGTAPMTEEQWLASLTGKTGSNGKSAYEVYVDSVPTGTTPMTEAEWLESLKGQDGIAPAYPVAISYDSFIGQIGILDSYNPEHYGEELEKGITPNNSYISDVYENTYDFNLSLSITSGIGLRNESNTVDHYETIASDEGGDYAFTHSLTANFVRYQNTGLVGDIILEYYEQFTSQMDKDIVHFFIEDGNYYFSWECTSSYEDYSCAYQLSEDSYKRVVASTIDYLKMACTNKFFEEFISDMPLCNEMLWDSIFLNLLRLSGKCTLDSQSKYSFESDYLVGSYEITNESIKGSKGFYVDLGQEQEIVSVAFYEGEFEFNYHDVDDYTPSTSVQETESMLSMRDSMYPEIVKEEDETTCPDYICTNLYQTIGIVVTDPFNFTFGYFIGG